jgi:hypothetical protein
MKKFESKKEEKIKAIFADSSSDEEEEEKKDK